MKNLNLVGTLLLSIALVAGMSGCADKPIITPIPDVPAGGTSSGGQTTSPPTTPPGIGNAGTLGNTPTPTPVNGIIPLDASGKYPFDGNQDPEKFRADTIVFDFDSATIKPSEESKLQEVASYFKDNTRLDALIIQGNCDERGTEKYNLSLGERRALAAREYLVNLGVDAARIKTMTFGASRPADPGHDESAWKKNRRDDFVLVTPK